MVLYLSQKPKITDLLLKNNYSSLFFNYFPNYCGKHWRNIMRINIFKRDVPKPDEDYSSKKTNIRFETIFTKIDEGSYFPISGYLTDEDKNKLANKGIVIFLDDKFVKTVISNNDGYFKDYFLAKNSGKLKITAYYDGNWKYEKTSASDIIDIKESVQIKQSTNVERHIENLEKIVDLYQQGMINEEEFKALKERIINQ